MPNIDSNIHNTNNTTKNAKSINRAVEEYIRKLEQYRKTYIYIYIYYRNTIG